MLQRLKNIYHLLQAFLANVYYGFPGRKLIVIGITGTSGKTTTAHMIYEVLKTAGYNVSLLSSIKAVIHGKEYDTGFHVTTPDPQTLPKYLKKAVDSGDTYFVLELSSHGLDQHRAACVNFTLGILTTLAHEHLDYHRTFENYARAKFKLLEASEVRVIPESLLPSLKKFGMTNTKLVTFGMRKGDETQEHWNLKLKLPGDFNVMNALAAAAAAKVLEVPEKIIKQALENFSAIPGRFEEIKNNKGFRIIIDFAHKPDALEGVLQAAKKEVKNNGKIIVMFGCASQRDILKRPIMGKISGELADITVLTDEDPRFEDSMKIINEIAQGCLDAGAKEHVFFKIPDRQKAINFIIRKLAKKDDIVLLCGKGHEKSMNYNGIEKPWSEHKAVEKALHYEHELQKN